MGSGGGWHAPWFTRVDHGLCCGFTFRSLDFQLCPKQQQKTSKSSTLSFAVYAKPPFWTVLGRWGSLCFRNPSLLSPPFGAGGLLGSWGPCFLEAVTFATSFWRWRAGGKAGGRWDLCFPESVTFVTLFWRWGESWGEGGALVSQNPSLLSPPFGAGAWGELGPCF